MKSISNKVKRMQLIILLTVLSSAFATTGWAQGVKFCKQDAESAIAQAKKEGKPVMIYFKLGDPAADGKLDEIFADKEVGDCFNGKTVCCEIVTTISQSWVFIYHLQALPSVVMLDGKGNVVYQINGDFSITSIIYLAKALNEEIPSLEKWNKIYLKDKMNPEVVGNFLLEASKFLNNLPAEKSQEWAKKLQKTYKDYRQVKSLQEMINAEDYVVLTTYSRGEPEVFDFLLANRDKYKEVVEENTVTRYLLNTNTNLIFSLAGAGNSGYEKYLNRVKGDMVDLYKEIKKEYDIYTVMKLNVDAVYALHRKGDVDTYVTKKNEYLNTLGEACDVNELFGAIQDLCQTMRGRLTKKAAEACLEWDDRVRTINTQVLPMIRMTLSLMLAECCAYIKDMERMRTFLNEAYLLAIQLGNTEMQQRIKNVLSNLH